ncbi:hypothetical protein [Lysobacter gummosus]|uniref:hypothetical protein n=1 Tax=Lysobacter gummosus TaxID=262324 RepID=UPI00362AC51E
MPQHRRGDVPVRIRKLTGSPVDRHGQGPPWRRARRACADVLYRNGAGRRRGDSLQLNPSTSGGSPCRSITPSNASMTHCWSSSPT